MTAAGDGSRRRALSTSPIVSASKVEVVASVPVDLVARPVRVDGVAGVRSKLLPKRIHPAALVELSGEWMGHERVERRLGTEDLSRQTEVLMSSCERHAGESGQDDCKTDEGGQRGSGQGLSEKVLTLDDVCAGLRELPCQSAERVGRDHSESRVHCEQQRRHQS